MLTTFSRTEVPFEVGVDERSNEATRCSIHVDWAVNLVGDKEIVDGFSVFVLARVGRAEDGADTDGIFVDKLHSFFGIDHESVFSAKDILLLNFEVASCFLPADLDSAVHDDVGVGGVLALCLALIDPLSLHSQDRKHDGFA